MRVVPITLKERLVYLVQYVKLPRFCFHCGLIGHDVMECGDGVHSKICCEWGDWLCVPFTSIVTGRDDFRGRMSRGRGSGRGCFSGQVEWMDDVVEDMEMSYDEEEDTEIAAAKQREAPEMERGACCATGQSP